MNYWARWKRFNCFPACMCANIDVTEKSADQVETSIIKATESLRISPRFTVRNWLDLNLDPDDPSEVDWNTAVEIVKDRIEGRFLRPAQALIEAEKNQSSATFGFAILALDFLVIETIEGFRQGCINHDRRSHGLFRDFLMQWAEFCSSVPGYDDQEKRASELYSQGRCALHHSGTTDRLRVGRRGRMLVYHEDGRIDINRTEFHGQLTAEFDRYLNALKNPLSKQLRANVKIMMDAICQK
ncbi:MULTISPECIES: hypothetical protein [Rhizobium]|uniref:hypothetical protein n=1 Tax=Rhizobium TaxID=379 RepID=UPI00103193DF|nr:MULTISPECIES: hypothetical protein [Rhizobium]QIO59970.1 hypothetical protein HA463_20640 [Rhizobium leguminosarum bv. trifolii]TAZ80022.1 hypothetical protein ELH68_20565 [Rhizobium ruizarguesonis]